MRIFYINLTFLLKSGRRLTSTHVDGGNYVYELVLNWTDLLNSNIKAEATTGLLIEAIEKGMMPQ